MDSIKIERDGGMVDFQIGDDINGQSHIGQTVKIGGDWEQFGYQWTFLWGGHAPVGRGMSPTAELALSDCEAYGLRFIRRMQAGK